MADDKTFDFPSDAELKRRGKKSQQSENGADSTATPSEKPKRKYKRRSKKQDDTDKLFVESLSMFFISASAALSLVFDNRNLVLTREGGKMLGAAHMEYLNERFPDWKSRGGPEIRLAIAYATAFAPAILQPKQEYAENENPLKGFSVWKWAKEKVGRLAFWKKSK